VEVGFVFSWSSFGWDPKRRRHRGCNIAMLKMLHRFGDSDFRESYTPFAWLLPPAEAIAKALYRKPK